MRRTLTLLGLAASALAAPAAQAAAPTAVGFAAVPGHVVQGTSAHVVVRARNAASCTLAVRYKGGTKQAGLVRVRVRAGLAEWTWEVPTSTQAGAATAVASCGRASVRRTFVVVGRVPAPRIVVARSGFTTRADTTGTRLSYGLILHNDAADRDAGDVIVQTNFVLADDHLLGTDTQRVSGIPAGGDVAFGHTVSFPGAAPITRLEFVVRVEGFQPHAVVLPTLANMHLVGSLFQPQWLGSIEGELQNTSASQTLQSATISAVVFDASGAILGGTSSGYLSQALPPGARSFLKVGGLDVIPTDRAATTMVCVWPTWAQVST